MNIDDVAVVVVVADDTYVDYKNLADTFVVDMDSFDVEAFDFDTDSDAEFGLNLLLVE